MFENTRRRPRLTFQNTIVLSFCANAGLLAAGGLAAYLFNYSSGRSSLFDAQTTAMLTAIEAAGWLLLGQGLVALLLALALRGRAEVAWGILVGFVAMLVLPVVFILSVLH